MHSFKRWTSVANTVDLAINSVTGDTFYAREFDLNQISNAAELGSLYDRFRINRVVVHMSYTPAAPMGGQDYTPAYYPLIMYKRDYDDATTPTVATEFYDSSQAQQFRFSATHLEHQIAIRPAAANTLWRAGAASGYSSVWRPWVDMAQRDVPHYGLKLFVKSLPGVNLGAITIRVSYEFDCINVR
jgi:hypothetical protein